MDERYRSQDASRIVEPLLALRQARLICGGRERNLLECSPNTTDTEMN